MSVAVDVAITYRWICNSCLRNRETRDPELPFGWVRYREGGAQSRSLHHCGDCAAAMRIARKTGQHKRGEASEGFTLVRAASQTALLPDFNPDEYPLHGDLVEGANE